MTKSKLIDLLNQMTLSEKVGQLIQLKGEYFFDDNDTEITGPTEELNISSQSVYNIGSILNTLGANRVKQIQDKFMAKNRLHIPLLFMADIINGYRTIFQIPLLQGCSWDLELIKSCAEIAAKEATVSGAHVNFSPMVDLVRDARWGRVLESTGGEDTYLGQVYAKAIVETYQKHNLSSCIKHFVAYGAVESGRDYNSVDMSEKELQEFYFPAYKTAIDAGADLVMSAFNTINSIPCTGNKWLMKDLLRNNWRFDGVIISDYSAIRELIYHGFAEDEKIAAYKAIEATIDIDMMTNVYEKNLKTLIEENRISMKQLDDAVLRILTLKNKLGLFENPYANLDIEREKTVVISKELLDKSRELTANTFVLLKNDNSILPLKKEANIALIGPYADNPAISGSWSFFNKKDHNTVTLKAGIENISNLTSIPTSKGSNILRQKEFNQILSADGAELVSIPNEPQLEKEYRDKAIEVSKNCDIIVLALGEHYRQSGEGGSRSDIELPRVQQDLVDELYKLGKPMVAILFSGRPLVIKELADKVDSLIWVGFPGTQGGNSIADVLYGNINPSGRLNITFPQSVGQCPIYYNHYNTGRPHIANSRFMSRYQDIPTEPYYPFGYGLSYSKFEYYDLHLSSNTIGINTPITVTLKVKNTSDIAGYEVIQLYIQDLVGSTVRPVKELKGFQKIHFNPQEEKEITFTITDEMLKFWNDKMEFVSEPGEFKVYVGRNSSDTLCDVFFKE